jgi:predicted secreted hydrolase
MSKAVYPGYRAEDLRREGLQPQPEVWEDGLRTDTAPGYFEWWYFDAHFDDGSTAVIVFYTKPILNRSAGLMPGLSVTITRPDGEKRVRFLLFSPDEFSAAQDSCNVRIGENRVKGDLKSYSLHVDSGDLAADLEMSAVVPAWRPGAGMNYYDAERKRYFAWLAGVPYGQVSGTLRYDGETHPVQGSIYHDHNWGNVGLEQVMSHWYWGRARVGEYTCIFVEMTSAKQYGGQKMPVFMLARGGEILIEDGRPLCMDARDFVNHSGGRSYPQQISFDWVGDPGRVHIKLSDLQIIEATSLLSSLPRWKQFLARLMGANPYYFRFNAAMWLDVAFGGIESTEHGQALYEIMLLR